MQVCARALKLTRSLQIIFQTHLVHTHTHLGPHDSIITFKQSLTVDFFTRGQWFGLLVRGGAEGLLIFTSQSHPREMSEHHFLSAPRPPHAGEH